MAIEGFDYKQFAKMLSDQAGDLIPKEFQEFQRNYIIKTIKNFSELAGEAIYNDTESNYSADIAMLITQIIAEWSFHKSVDLIRSGIQPDYWDSVMQKIAFTIFEIAKQCLKQNVEQDQMLVLIEHHVKQAYNDAIEELQQKGMIDESVKERAENQSNIDAMMDQIQKDKADAEAQSQAQTAAQEGLAGAVGATAGAVAGAVGSDNKILKLASVALLLKQFTPEKAKKILQKFSQEDANMIIQYMQMPDLEQKVDKSVAMQYLKEMQATLPEPVVINPDKILAKLQKVFSEKEREDIELLVRRERPFVKKFIFKAYEGEYYPLPTKIANIIANYVVTSV